LEAEQLVTHGAADEVCVETQRANVVLDGLHAVLLGQRDSLDLDERARGEVGHFDRRAGRRNAADVPCVDLVHGAEVVEVLEEDGRLDDPVERAPGSLEDRAQVRERLLGLVGDVAGDEFLLARLQRQLAGDEHETVRLDRLRVRRPLEGRGCCVGADRLLHSRHAIPSAAPRALKIARSTCSGSLPSSTRMCTFRPAPPASSSRKRATTSPASPPTRCPEKSTFEATCGSSETSSTAPARASPAGSQAQPWPVAPGLRRSDASASPRPRPAAATSSSALPGATSSERRSRPIRASSPTRWSSTGRPVATPALPSDASSTRTPVCVPGTCRAAYPLDWTSTLEDR